MNVCDYVLFSCLKLTAWLEILRYSYLKRYCKKVRSLRLTYVLLLLISFHWKFFSCISVTEIYSDSASTK